MKGLLATSASQVEAGKQQIQQLRWVRGPTYWGVAGRVAESLNPMDLL